MALCLLYEQKKDLCKYSCLMKGWHVYVMAILQPTRSIGHWWTSVSQSVSELFPCCGISSMCYLFVLFGLPSKRMCYCCCYYYWTYNYDHIEMKTSLYRCKYSPLGSQPFQAASCLLQEGFTLKRQAGCPVQQNRPCLLKSALPLMSRQPQAFCAWLEDEASVYVHMLPRFLSYSLFHMERAVMPLEPNFV